MTQIISRPERLSSEEEELAGRKTGIESCEIFRVKLLPGAEDDPPPGQLERLFFVLSGEVEILSGSERVRVGRGGFAFLPRTRLYRLCNTFAADATLLDVRVPIEDNDCIAVPPSAGNRLSELVGQVADERFSAHHVHRAEGHAFDTQVLIDRAMGAERLKVFAAIVQPGSGMGLHIHPFDQFYFILEGAMDVQIGLRSTQVIANTLVTFPSGIVHRNRNAGSKAISQITINVPEAPAGQVGTFNVTLSEMKR